MSLLESQWFLVCHQSQQRGLTAPLVFSLSMHSLEQDECLSDPNWLLEMEGSHLLWLQHECSKDTAPLIFHTRCFTNPTLLYTNLAHALVSTSEPPCLGYNEHTHKCENCSGMMFWSRKTSSDAKLYLKMIHGTWWKPLYYITHCSIILLWSCRPCCKFACLKSFMDALICY